MGQIVLKVLILVTLVIFSQPSAIASIADKKFNDESIGMPRAIYSDEYCTWIGGENGLFKKCSETIAYKIHTDEYGQVSDISSYSEKEIIVASYGYGIYIVNRYDNNIRELIIEGLSVEKAWKVKSSLDKIIISLTDDIVIFDRKNGKAVSLKNLGIDPGSRIYEIDYRDGNIAWVDRKQGLSVYNIKDNGLSHYSISKYFRGVTGFYSVYIDDEKIYVGTNRGIYILKENNEISQIQRRGVAKGKRETLAPIRKIKKDNYGVIWAAAENIYVVNESKERLESPKLILNNLKRTSVNLITDFAFSKYNDIKMLDTRNGLVEVSSLSYATKSLSRSEEPYTKNINNIIEAGSDSFIASSESKLLKFLPSGKIVKEIETSSDSDLTLSKGNGAIFFTVDENGVVSKYDSDLNILDSYKVEGIEFVSDFQLFGNKGYFLGEYKGVSGLFELDGLVVTKIFNSDVSAFSVIENELMIITKNGFLFKLAEGKFEIKNRIKIFDGADVIGFNKFGNNIVIYTSGDGLIIFNDRSKRVSEICCNEFSHVRAVSPIDDRFFLLATNNGLFYYDYIDSTLFHINEIFGIYDNDFEYSGLLSLDDTIAVVGDLYTYLINKKAFIGIMDTYRKRKYSLDIGNIVYLQDLDKFFKYSGKSNFIMDSAKNDITINSDVDFFKFRLVNDLPKYNSQFDIMYKLDGFSNEWLYSNGKYETVFFNSLSIGRHLFEAKIIDKINGKIIYSKNFSINKLPPFWFTWQAFIIYILLFLCSSISFYAYKKGYFVFIKTRMARVLGENDNVFEEKALSLENIVAIKQKAFVDLSHSIRSSISRIDACINQENSCQYRMDRGQVKASVDELVAVADLVSDLDKLDECLNSDLEFYKVSEVAPLLLASINDYVSEHIQLECSVNGDNVFYLTRGSLSEILFRFITGLSKAADTNKKIYILFDSQALHFNLTVSLTPINSSNLAIQGEQIVTQTEGTNTSHKIDGYDLISGIISLNGGWLERFVDGEKLVRLSAIIPISDVFRGRYSPQIDNVPEKVSDLKEVVDSCKSHRNKPVLLIIEANDDIRQHMFNMLRDNYCCLFAQGLEDATRIVELVSPSILLLDYVNNGTCGIKIVRQLRELKPVIELGVVMSTSLSIRSVRYEALRMGIDHIVPKPLDESSLRFAIEHSLAFREAFAASNSTTRHQSDEVCNVDQPTPEFKNVKDQNFYLKFVTLVKNNYNNESFTRSYVASQMAMSERQLNRRMAELFDYNYSEFIKLFRLKKSEQLLIDQVPITTVAYEVGFSSSSYFSTCFKSVYSITPKQFQEDAFKESLRNSR